MNLTFETVDLYSAIIISTLYFGFHATTFALLGFYRIPRFQKEHTAYPFYRGLRESIGSGRQMLVISVLAVANGIAMGIMGLEWLAWAMYAFALTNPVFLTLYRSIALKRMGKFFNRLY